MDPHILEKEKEVKVPWTHSSCKTVLIAVRWHIFDEEKRIDLEYYRVPRSYYLAEFYPYYLVPSEEQKQKPKYLGNEDWICFLKLLGNYNDAHQQYPLVKGKRVSTPASPHEIPFEPYEHVVSVDYIVDSPYIPLRIAPYKQCSRCQRWWLTSCKVCF